MMSNNLFHLVRNCSSHRQLTASILFVYANNVYVAGNLNHSSSECQVFMHHRVPNELSTEHLANIGIHYQDPTGV